MLEVFDDLLICENKEAIACILVLLSVKLGSDGALHTINLSLVVLFFVNTHAAAPASDSSTYFDLAPNCPRLLVKSLHER